MRITLVISSLSSGGAERVMSIMANYWAEKNWTVTLLTFDGGEELPFYELHPRVKHVALGIAGASANVLVAVSNNLRRVRIMREFIRQTGPNVVISFFETVNILSILATRKLGIPVIVCERTDPASHRLGRVWSLLRGWSYLFATKIVVQSQDALSYFSHDIQLLSRVIPNPVIAPPRCDKVIHVGASKNIAAMGRLSEEKGFDLLLKAFARIAPTYHDWLLIIWGEGNQRKQLEELCDQLGLRERVSFPGRTTNSYEKLREAELFVLSSRFEGFPNVLCEAMSCGLPVISFDCPSGPRNIIRHNVDGILVPANDIEAMAMAMADLMKNDAERKRLSSNAISVIERFSLEKVMSLWNQLLTEVSHQQST